jgi:putative oxidoreductase
MLAGNRNGATLAGPGARPAGGFAGVLERGAGAAYGALRIVAGLMFAFHGLQKIFGVLSEFQPPIGTQVWFGGVIELVCGLGIALGVATRWAAFLASGTMAVAYTQFHWKLAGGPQLIPGVNKGELALLYALLFLFIACQGPGPLSVDGRRASGGGRGARLR